MASRTRRKHRGTTLVELMVAMSIMSFGLLGMAHMQIIGITSNAAGRRHTTAMALAKEVASGLERLAYADALVNETGPTGPTPPPVFGRLVVFSPLQTIATGATLWNDATPVPGVRTDTELALGGQTGFSRRWTVWGYSPAAGGRSAVKMIAVSVTWLDPPSPIIREVVAYTQLYDQSTFGLTLGANQ